MFRSNEPQVAYQKIADIEERFPISLDDYAKLVGISRNDHAARALKRNYTIDEDYTMEVKPSKKNQNKKNYRMTLNCAQKMYGRSPPKRDTFGYIYIIRHGDTNMFKIGHSINAKERLRDLQIGNPVTLKLMTTFQFNDAKRMEQRIHHLLRKYHLRGEWFHCSYRHIVTTVVDEMELE